MLCGFNVAIKGLNNDVRWRQHTQLTLANNIDNFRYTHWSDRCNKTLSCRRETARRFVSLDVSLKVTENGTMRKPSTVSYSHSIATTTVYLAVST